MLCRNEQFMKMVGVGKLDKKVEVDFDVQRNLPDCNRINAKKYVTTEAETPTYDQYRVPVNQFECMNPNCVNSGTLYNGGAATVYKAIKGEDFSAGVITFYVTEDVTQAEVTISDSQTATNAWKYTVTPGRAVNGFKPVIVDMTQTPTKVGTGFTPSDATAYIGITLTSDGNTAGNLVVCSNGVCTGLSSIAIFDDLEDFQTSTHVKVSCLTGIDGTWDLDVAESTCFNNGYDTSSRPSFEKTVTGTKVTNNYWRLSPLYQKGSATQGFDIVTVERTIKAGTGDTYGVVAIDDMNQNECGFFSVEVQGDACGSNALDKLSVPSIIALDGGHYLLVDNGDGATSAIFNSMYIGKKVLISYPKLVDVEEFLISTEGLNEVRTRMSYVKKYTDGEKYRFVFDNVLITSFPDALTEDEGEFAFTVSIQPDAYGRYGRAYKIID